MQSESQLREEIPMNGDRITISTPSVHPAGDRAHHTHRHEAGHAVGLPATAQTVYLGPHDRATPGHALGPGPLFLE